ncbi:flagellar basal-body MS-ring/collar protein FliF [Paenibacillus sp.]|uniref:flagellar basal-body MS-ring/collar protein FliF n=1 Tax=Paenibacillus sp. TaxID=58172 RepID=UPI002810C048|nr:flagellar basal-body MS-ring/collar protein FliF [Paenibacillus sp.]
MNETLVRYREAILRFWGQYSNKQRFMFIGAFVLSVATIALLVFQFSKTEYSVAFTDLNPTDAANVKGYLESSGIPYKLSLDGRTIGVPSTDVSSVKIDVASQGLVTNGSIGYEIFRENMNSWSMTDSQFDVLNADARSGEIQRLINQISGVSSSEVLINSPKQSVFLNPDGAGQQSTASVVVNFTPGFPPDQAKIDTIYNLVAKSVPNLTLDNITISDQNGELLPSSKLGAGAGASAGQLEQQMRFKKQFELDLQRNVMSFLAPLLGQEDVIVSVFSTLNFDQRKSQENLVTPVNQEDGTGIIISRNAIEETVNSTGGETGGTTGTGETDVPGYPGTTSQGNLESEKSDITENFEVNRITNEIVKSPYVVQDLSISVGINADNDPETVAQVEALLKNIVGTSLANTGVTLTDEQLSSKVSVISRSFGGSAATTAANDNQTLLYAIAGAAVMALLAGGGFFLVRRRKAQAEAIAQAELEAAAAAASQPEVVLDIEQVGNDSQIRKQLEQLAKRKPEEFTNLLRTWLADE